MLKPLKGILINNTPPNKPIINGPQRGKPGNLCTYEIQTTDPEENEIYYYISWGDETKENWRGDPSRVDRLARHGSPQTHC